MSGAVALAVMVFPGTQTLPLFAAQATGSFRRRGLTVDIRTAANSAEQRRGLAEGHHQIAQGAADQAVAMVEAAMADAVVVLGGDGGFNRLFVQPDVRTYGDLRGRTLAVDVPDTGWSFLLYRLLEEKGLARSDYEVAAVGAPFRRFAAMRQDAPCAAAMLNPPFSIHARRAGLRDMGAATTGPYQGFVTYVLRSWARANADTLVAYLAAYIEGLRWSLDPANRTEAVDLLARRLDLARDIAAEVYRVAVDPVDGLAVDARLDIEGFKTVLALRADFEGGIPAAPERYIDLSYYGRALASL
jgi:ABC-type nitrate/sulfonate/bicarbonate transport system substrate-binding protein